MLRHHVQGFLLLDTRNRPLWFAVTNGLITSITDQAGTNLVYEYDDDGYLNRIVYPRLGGARREGFRFAYGQDGSLRRLAKESIAIESEYDRSGRVINQRLNAATYVIEYATEANTRRTRVTDDQGNTCTVAYDGEGHPIEGQLGLQLRLRHSAKSFQARSQEALVVSRNYNEHGEVTKRVFANETCEWSYDE